MLSASVTFFQDGNGYIDEQELDALLRDLYQKNKKVRWGREEFLSTGTAVEQCLYLALCSPKKDFTLKLMIKVV